MKKSFLSLSALALISALLVSQSSATDTVIAQWDFVPGANFLVDSVGGHNLVQGTGSPVTAGTGPGGVGYSAHFDGTGFLVTASTLDLTAYRQLKLSWSMKDENGGAFAGVFNHGWNSVGAFYVDVYEAPGKGYAGFRSQGIPNNGYKIQSYPTVDTLWANYTMVMNLDGGTFADQLQLFKNGVLVGTTEVDTGTTSSFLNTFFELGALNGGAYFVGDIANVTLSSAAAPKPIYRDNFSGNGTTYLDGTTPDVTTQNAIWTATSNWNADGSMTTSSFTDDVTASLPFTPTSGKIYELSLSNLQSSGTSPGWISLAFLSTTNTYGFLGSPNAPAIIRRRDNTTTIFPGGPSLSTTGAIRILLDTTATNWKTDFFFNGSPTSSYTYTYTSGNPDIQYVGISGTNDGVGTLNGTVANFRLQTIYELSYGDWAVANAGGQTADLDWDNDGVSNGAEYFMNAAAGFTANPSLVGNTVTWPNGGNILSSAYGSQFEVQTSTDLANWSAVASDDITLSNTAGALTWKVASIANGDMGSFTGNLPSSWVVSGGTLTSAQSAGNSPFTNKFADNGSSWIIDDSTDTSGTAGFLQVFSNKTNYPSVEVNFDFKLTALTGGTWGIQFDGDGVVDSLSSSSVHFRIDAAGQFAINAGPGGGTITNILALEANKWYNVRATFTTTAVNTGSSNGAGVQSGTITPAGGSPVSWSNVPLLNTSLGFSRLLVRDRDATFAGDLLLDNVSVAPLLGKQFVRLKVTPN